MTMSGYTFYILLEVCQCRSRKKPREKKCNVFHGEKNVWMTRECGLEADSRLEAAGELEKRGNIGGEVIYKEWSEAWHG